VSETDLVRCPNCGATNRVPRLQITEGRKAVCGRCRTPLPAARGPVTVTDASFAGDVERATLPVLLDLWAPWCGPCHAMAPIVDELAAELAGRVVVGKMNVDENPQTAMRFDVRSIPTMLLLRAGREIDRIVGAQPKSEIVRRLARSIG
jgi:thioredoxin 2